MATKKQPVVEVTAELIGQAVKADAGFCMIAEAIKAAYPGVTNVLVDLQSIRYTDRKAGNRLMYLTPSDCQMQLLRFDQGMEVQPWAFRLPSRPSQVTPCQVAKKAGSALVRNAMGRPSTRGPKRITERASNYVPTVKGGPLPPVAVLAHGGAGTGSKSRRRQFGLRLAGTFDGFVEAPNCKVAQKMLPEGASLVGGCG